jgi:hypothetical protein
MLNFESANKMLPPSRVWDMIVGDGSGSWSAQARVLPFLEETITFDFINFKFDDDVALLPNGNPVQTIRVATYVCPSEINDVMRTTTGSPHSWPFNYAVEHGYLVRLRSNDQFWRPGSVLPQRDIENGKFH